ncbi:beta-lactamase class A [Synechococcus sp. BIOS-E4-1]|uniref:serine hydrolase n=1 Tax=Synechococcus sp. BIOS-E4-1 TaxID=1400864 RepID=UPI0016482B59|nr:serine hydrolase [Synechococcus sp. BIOS-E4-1]QNI55453.1 beta-lactamase class A [Synechococcus sp. BIOS-E4-1]
MASSRSRRQNPGWGRPLRLVLRLVLMGVGLGVITGSLLKLAGPAVEKGDLALPGWLPLNEQSPEGKAQPEATANDNGTTSLNRTESLGRFETRNELKPLSERWQTLAAEQPDLKVSAFMLVLDDGRYAQLEPDTALPAASSIKTPILLVTLEELDAGRLSWNEPLQLSKTVVGGGAGWMASKPLGTRFPTHEVATEMIRVSDNTATNLLIERLGGQETLNARFNALGLSATKVNDWLPDLKGTNSTSARDLARSIALVDTGEALSIRSRDLFREVMGTSITNTLLPRGLMRGLGGRQGEPDDSLMVKGYRVLNKTGDIGIAYADAGLIELPDGSRAVAAFLVKGPFNDPRSTELIRKLAAAMAPVLKPKPAVARSSASAASIDP